DEGAAVVDAHAHGLAVVPAGHVHDRAEGQVPVRRGELGGVEDLSGGGRLALEPVVAPVPGSKAFFAPTRPCVVHGHGMGSGTARGAGGREKEREPGGGQSPRAHTRTVAPSAAGAPWRAGSSSSRMKASTCSALRPTRRSGRATSE